MTTVITRFFDSASQARKLRRELLFANFPRQNVTVFGTAEGLVDTLKEMRVDAATAEAYEHRVARGGAVALVVVRYKPLGGAATARVMMAEMGATRLGNLPEEVFIKDPLEKPASVLAHHPHYLLADRDPESTTYHMANWPIPLISRRKPYSDTLLGRHARMAEWPLPLTARLKPRDEFAFPRHARMANLVLPLTIRRAPSDNFIFPRHARMAEWPLALTNRRKPYTGSVIGRDTRMANWPFPLLINGKQGQNSIVPNGARMANFPIPLTSDRKPVDKFAFPRHARMADLFLPLVNRRKPFTGTIIPRHGRMANFLLPLIAKQRAKDTGEDSGFSLSKFFGIPTLSRR
ncbi:MAG: PucR family transcriptional regulator [Pseudomonadota bacterium]